MSPGGVLSMCRERASVRWRTAALIVGTLVTIAPVQAQTTGVGQPPLSPSAAGPAPAPAIPAGVQPPPGYVIGAGDMLSIVFWRDKDMTGDVVVRPDGRITLPLVSDIQAAGLTPEQLRERIAKEASRFLEDPSVTVVVKEIHSLNVFITGQVAKPGAYPLTQPMSVLQLISVAGGLNEFAKRKEIVIARKDGDNELSLRFNYQDVLKGKNLKQNVQLRAGDTVLVP